MSRSWLDDLRRACADTRADAAALDARARDMGAHAGARPDAVCAPRTVEEVAAIVRTCARHRRPVVARGAGTGLEGGAVAYGGGCVLDTRMLRAIEIDEANMCARVGAGALKSELNAALAKRGFAFGPDPSSNPTLGGMASTGGSGLSTLKYGTTKENVRSMTVVTPDGEIIRTRAEVRKSSTGYELNALYLGAEGTLGVIAAPSCDFRPSGRRGRRWLRRRRRICRRCFDAS